MLRRDPDIAYWERKAATSQDLSDRLYLAQLYRERGAWELACDQCRAILQTDPEFPPAMAELAETLFLMGDRQAALRRYSDAEAFGVGLSLDMEFRRALCLYSVGRVDDAEKALKALTDDEPDFDAAHDALIGIYEESGQKRKASSAERRRKKHRSKQRRDSNADALLRFLEAELRNPDRW